MSFPRHYTHVPVSAEEPPVQPPGPGTGTVFVVEDRDGTWRASWQSDDGLEEVEGATEAHAKAWARSRSAPEHLVFSPERNDHIDL